MTPPLPTRRIGRYLPWLVLLGLVAGVELLVRFAISFSLRRVLLVEAVAFLAAGVVGVLLSRRSAHTGWFHVLEWTMAAAFLLGSVRALAWTLGMPVVRANMLIAVLAIVALGAVWWRRRAVQIAKVKF